jgi:hypothetical protein
VQGIKTFKSLPEKTQVTRKKIPARSARFLVTARRLRWTPRKRAARAAHLLVAHPSPPRCNQKSARNLPQTIFFHPKFGPSVEHWRGTESTENSTKSDGIEQATADRKAPFGPQNAQSRKGMSAPGNSCRPEALPRNSAQERYTSPRLCTRATPSSRWALARNVPRVTRERADVISLRVRRYRTVGLPRCVPARLDTGGHKGLTGV